MKINSSEIIHNSKKTLENLAMELDMIEIVAFQDFVLETVDFRDLYVFKEAVVFPKTLFPIIYSIELLDSEIREDLIERFKKFSKANKTLKIKKIKHSKYNDNVANSSVLYVGSSINDFSSRLKDHLGLKGHSTYALHLSKWDENLKYSIRIKTYEIKHMNGTIVDRDIVEIVEQQIWDKLQPVFGKRSGLL